MSHEAKKDKLDPLRIVGILGLIAGAGVVANNYTPKTKEKQLELFNRKIEFTEAIRQRMSEALFKRQTALEEKIESLYGGAKDELKVEDMMTVMREELVNFQGSVSKYIDEAINKKLSAEGIGIEDTSHKSFNETDKKN